jgi:hypothetical protein
MPRKPLVYEPRSEANAYCPKCNTTCWYTVGQQHYKYCDGILVSVKDKYKYAPVPQR